MLTLLITIMFSYLFQLFMRISSDKISKNMSLLTVNYVICALISACYTGLGNLFPVHEEGFIAAVGVGFGQGLMYLLAFILLQINISRNGMVLSTSCMKLGLLVPMAISVVVFGEKPGIVHIVGFILALISIVLINYEPKGAANATFKSGLVILLLTAGLGDAMAKFYEEWGTPALGSHFLFYTFVAAALISIGILIFRKEVPGKAEIFYGILVGVPNYFVCRFVLKSLEILDAVIVYPCYNVATIFLATLTGLIFFKERLKKRQWVAICTIIVALVLLNL